jgi:hypothetical protein
LNRSWSVTADVEVPEGGANGMVVTHGGLVGGYGLYFRDGKPTFVYNYLSLDRPTIAATEPLAAGKVELKVDFDYHGAKGEVGKGATVVMSANGKEIARGELDKTIPNQISLGEGLDVGMDVGSAVDFTYKPPFAFTGRIDKVVVQLR